MISRSFLTSILGLTLVLVGAGPSITLAQTKTGETGTDSARASKLEQAKVLSAASGRPILAVAGLAN